MKKRFRDFVLKIGLASDTVIRGWSSGEVKKAETINYKTGKPVIDGLFCERIFGPIKDYECQCGKYKHIRSKGKVCERCNVLVTSRNVRRSRMGHIELDEPICHIWFYKSIPSKLSAFLNIPISDLEEIIYFRSYAIVKTNTNSDNKISLGSLLNLQTKISNLNEKNEQFLLLQKILNDLLDEFEKNSQMYLQARNYLDALQSHADDFLIEEFIEFVNDESLNYQFKTGGFAIEALIKKVDILKEIELLKAKIAKRRKNKKINEKILRRLEILNTFKNTKQDPVWMLTRTIPVLPPELRPIVSLEGGRFAASGINALYIELLIRKNRLQKFKEKDAPLFMINELRNSVQEAVNSLFDNSLSSWNKSRNLRQIGQRKSVATNLKGKTGRFRQNLLGKRVDYSGGSVITGGPELKFNEFGLPRDIAIVLFNVAILGRLMNKGINKKVAEEMINQRQPIVWEILEEIVKGYPMILNRAPTLHRLGIQAFFPKLIRGQAIMLHPLVTTAFNADFDGDRMPIHLPLTEKAKQEAIDILMSDKNILNPRNGKLIVMPSQDIILGIYYLTLEMKNQKGEGNIFANFNDAMLAYWNGKITLHALIFIDVKALQKNNLQEISQKFILTTIGKLIFNRTFNSYFPFLNSGSFEEKLPLFSLNTSFKKVLQEHVVRQPINKAQLIVIIDEFLNLFGFEETVKLLDCIKDLGFKYATYSGMTISLFKVLEHKTNKKDLFEKTEKELDKIRFFHRIGAMTSAEKKALKIKKWSKVKEKVEQQLKTYFDDLRLDQSVRFMVKSGARGSISNFTQFVGMRGLMINTQGKVIDTPIKSSLAEGLNVLEYYISTYGARKGMVDTALKTADSGYLTRRLVDAMHDVYTTEFDCQTKNYQIIKAIYGPMNSIIIPLSQRIFGRFSAENVYDKENNLLISINEMITQKIAKKIEASSVKEVKVRSILSCEILRGVCCMCFGLDLAKNKVIEKHQAVGVLAAQSIGEPATQLTMRTFHTGGVSDVADITQGLPRVIEIFDCVIPKGQNAILAEMGGEIIAIKLLKDRSYDITIKPFEKKTKIKIFNIPSEFNLIVKLHQKIKKGAPITEGSANLKELLRKSSDNKLTSDYIVSEVQKIYSLQGIEISDKYIEIVANKMLSRGRIIDSGDSHYVIGQTMEIYLLIQENRKLAKQNLKLIVFEQIICGIKEIATKTYSFLSAASFQETTKVLIQATIENRIDHLYGLKENVICGNLIPVGSGVEKESQS